MRLKHMDFNDLNLKLKRVYSAVDEQYDEDISSNIVDDFVVDLDGSFSHSTTFGKNEPHENQNILMNPIHLIASLKDIIKKRLEELGKDPQLFENWININQSLGIIIDLDNQDKHGLPLRTPRTGLNPDIIDIQQGLHGEGATDIVFSGGIGKPTRVQSISGNVKVVVVANIVDSSGQLIMDFDTLVNKSLSLIEEFLEDHDLRSNA